MINMNKNNQSIRDIAIRKHGMVSACRALIKLFFGISVRDKDYGASGNAPARLNRFSSLGVVPFAAIVRSMIARRNIVAAAMRTAVKVDVNGFVDQFRLTAEPSRMTDRGSAFSGIFRGLFLFVFFEWSLERFGKFSFKMRFFVFKFFNPLLKFLELMVGQIHGEFKFINAFAKIFAFGFFTIEKHTKLFERAKRIADMSGTVIHSKRLFVKWKNQRVKRHIRQNCRMINGGYF